MAEDMHAGSDRPLLKPSLPELTIVAIRAERRLSMAAFVDACSLSHWAWLVYSYPLPPKLRLTAANWKLARFWKTHSKAAFKSEFQVRRQGDGLGLHRSTLSMREKICIAAICASLATPEKYWFAFAPLPAAMPAMCVPWKQPSIARGQFTPVSTPKESPFH